MSHREDYPHRLDIPTRWHDNDLYGHVNNVQYYAFFDTVINRWLIVEGGLDIHRGPVIGLCAESHCDYRGPLAFPETVEAGLRVARLTRSSVRYEIGLFRPGVEEPGRDRLVRARVRGPGHAARGGDPGVGARGPRAAERRRRGERRRPATDATLSRPMYPAERCPAL
ncbi:MAG: acyl-CoA thioesterase [Thermoleophilaceae bacterium]